MKGRTRICLAGILSFSLVLATPNPAAATTFTLETADSPVLVPPPIPFAIAYEYPSLAIDALGNPHVSYADETVPSIKYAVKTGASWTIETVIGSVVDYDGFTRAQTSLALDAAGNPHIAFYDVATQSLQYASKSGGSWTFETIDNAANVGLVPSLALDGAGVPHVAYYDQTNFDLKYATKPGATWLTETVDAAGIVGGDPSLALDASGSPHVSYSSFTTGELRYARKSGGSWTIEPVFAVSPGSSLPNSIAVDASGRPCISYWSITTQDLLYSVKTGGVWSTETVDAVGNVGQDNSLALSGTGFPRISYYDATNRNLKFATKVGGSWTVEVVDAPGTVGRRTSLALDGSGNPRIVYLDLTNSSLKYASGESSGGFVSGTLLADCPSAGTPLAGVTIDAFDVGSLMLTGTAVTDASGNYTLGPLAPGNHNVVMVTPLGYTAAVHEQVVSVTNGQTASLDFALQCEAPSGDVRAVGFWKHQVGVATSGKGSAELDAAALCGYLDLVAAHFNSNDVNPVVVYQPPPSGDCDDKLFSAANLLNLQGSVAMRDRARQQLLALLLNVASGRIGTMSVVSQDGATASQAITYCDNLIDSPSGDHERAKSIADDINNGKLVHAGMIPLSTAQIAYRRELALRTFQVTPNPGPGARTFRFAMGQAGRVRLNVFDVSGRLVTTVMDRQVGSGPQAVSWNGATSGGAHVGGGIYFARLETESGSKTLKVIQLTP